MARLVLAHRLHHRNDRFRDKNTLQYLEAYLLAIAHIELPANTITRVKFPKTTGGKLNFTITNIKISGSQYLEMELPF